MCTLVAAMALTYLCPLLVQGQSMPKPTGLYMTGVHDLEFTNTAYPSTLQEMGQSSLSTCKFAVDGVRVSP